MSFSVEFVATSKVKAQAALKQAHLPSSVRDFLSIAVDGLPLGDEDRKRFIHVKGHGHLCEGNGSFSVSSAALEVREIVPNV